MWGGGRHGVVLLKLRWANFVCEREGSVGRQVWGCLVWTGGCGEGVRWVSCCGYDRCTLHAGGRKVCGVRCGQAGVDMCRWVCGNWSMSSLRAADSVPSDAVSLCPS